MKATSSPLPNLATIQNPKTSTCSVGFNANFTTLAGRVFFAHHISIYLFAILSLHAGVSTVEPQTRQAIPFEAFVDAVEEYEADSETDDEGDQMNA
jgi:hypothetical protein